MTPSKRKKPDKAENGETPKAALPLQAGPPEVQLEVSIDAVFLSIRLMSTVLTRRYVDRATLKLVENTTEEISKLMPGIIAEFDKRGEAYADMSKVQT